MGTFDGIKYIVVLLAKTKKYAVLDVEFDEIASDEFETKDEAVEAFEKLLGLKTDEGSQTNLHGSDGQRGSH